MKNTKTTKTDKVTDFSEPETSSIHSLKLSNRMTYPYGENWGIAWQKKSTTMMPEIESAPQIIGLPTSSLQVVKPGVVIAQ